MVRALLFAFFAAMAETERENIRESTLEGLDAATRKGKHGGGATEQSALMAAQPSIAVSKPPLPGPWHIVSIPRRLFAEAWSHLPTSHPPKPLRRPTPRADATRPLSTRPHSADRRSSAAYPFKVVR
ncbi:recombinase family protein [Streptomyces sp. NBC_01378]|uniref:Recombinase family protein n=1 Tax=Streptomyces sp. NBC_00119 TaxID=2975659 RepID=A0AAU1UM24_9ACTN